MKRLRPFAHFSTGNELLFSYGFIGIVCVFSTSLVRNMCVLVKTSKYRCRLKLVEGVILRTKENFQFLYYFFIFQEAKL